MAGRGNCRRTTVCAERAQGSAAEERGRQEVVPMCRHVHPVPGRTELQLCELQRLMSEQNRLLEEVLQRMGQRKG